MTSQSFSLRADIHLPAGIERKTRSAEQTRLRVCTLPAVDTILEALLIRKARIAFAKFDVGDIRVDLFILTHHQSLIRMIVAIDSQLFALKIGFIFSD